MRKRRIPIKEPPKNTRGETVHDKKKATYLEADAQRKAQRRLRTKEAKVHHRRQFTRASRVTQTKDEGGTGTQAAARVAQAERSDALQIMHPSVCALNDVVASSACHCPYFTWCKNDSAMPNA